MSSLGTPLVNNAGGYAIAATTMVVDGITGALHVGDSFKVGTDETLYVISAHSETSTNTTSVTFAPGLVVAAVDNEAIHLQKHYLDAKIGGGTFTYDEKRKYDYILDRGHIDTVRQGDDEPVDVRFDFTWEFLSSVSGATIPTFEEALKVKGPAAIWVTSGADPCEPFSHDIEIIYEPPCGAVNSETILLKEFRWESLNHDLKAGTVAVTGKCKIIEATNSRGS